MTVHDKVKIDPPQKTDVTSPVVSVQQDDDSAVATDQIGTRGGKEQDAIYHEQSALLGEVKEKYREADLEAEKKVQEAIGGEAEKKSETVVPPDLAAHGVKHHEEYARDVLKNGGTLELPMGETAFEQGAHTKISGKRLLSNAIVGVSSLAALAIYVERIMKVAHKHARRLIFRGQKPTEEEK